MTFPTLSLTNQITPVALVRDCGISSPYPQTMMHLCQNIDSLKHSTGSLVDPRPRINNNSMTLKYSFAL